MTKKPIVKNFIIETFMTVILFFPNKVWSQEASPKSMGDGWAVHLGAGFMYGGNLGVLGEKQNLLKENFRISPYAAFGIAEGGWLGLTSGANMELGIKHRLILGPQIEIQKFFGKSVEVKKNILPSVAFIVGYKYTSDLGLIWQFYIGDIYIQDETTDSKMYSHKSHVGLGFGYKY